MGVLVAMPSCTTPFRRASSTSLSCECRGGGPESTSVLTLDGFKVWDPTIYELLPYTPSVRPLFSSDRSVEPLGSSKPQFLRCFSLRLSLLQVHDLRKRDEVEDSPTPPR